MLESAEPSAVPEVVAGGAGAVVAAIEEPPEPVYEGKKIGVIAWMAIGWLVFIIVVSLLAFLLPLNPRNKVDYLCVNAGVGTNLHSSGFTQHWLGCDDLGRDTLSRVIWGGQASLLIAIGSVALGTLIGGALGLVAGFKGGNTDTGLSAAFNIILAFPQLVLALTLVAVFAPAGPNATWHKRMFVVVLAVGIVSIPVLARITRANTLAWSQREFVMAARAQGATDIRVMTREVLPNVLPAMLSIALLGVAIVIILEGSLAIFGLSISLPDASWGNMIYSQVNQLDQAPAVWLVPSILIFLTVLSLNYLGDVVRSRFDVRESVI